MQSRPQTAPIVIGLDFGTSSTKVVFRRLGESVSWVARSPAPAADFPWFGTPTRIAAVDSTIRMGGHVPPGENSGNDPLKLRLLDSDGFPDRFNEVQVEAVGYLGWILEEAAAAIRVHYGLEHFRPIVNIGVPVAYFGDADERKKQFHRYGEVLKAALATTTMHGGPGIRQGMQASGFHDAVQDAARRLRDANSVASSVADSGAVLPESIAALVSLEREPSVEPGIYSVVDIGAGTTEISTSLLSVTPEGRKVSCYKDSTERVGILSFPETDGSHKQRHLHGWWRQFEKNWEESRRKDAQNRVSHRTWAQTSLVFTGGGGFHPAVQDHFEERITTDSPARLHFDPGAWSMERRAYRPSAQVLEVARAARESNRQAFHLLAVAHGLSFHRREWPEWYRPDDVEPVEGPEREDPPYDPWDAGYYGR